MTENEAIEALKLEGGLEITGRPIRAAQFFEGIDVAIKALEEIQRWHTSEVNPNIKNVFANMSTQICNNCDHKDEYIVELEAEIEQYRAIGTVEELITAMKYVRLAKAHRTVGRAIEECAKYEEIGTPEECRAAVEKQTARKGIREKIKEGYNRGMHHYYCPVCYEKGDLRNKYNVGLYCSDCGQKLDWSDEE